MTPLRQRMLEYMQVRNVIDQVRGAFGHATAAPRRAESTTPCTKTAPGDPGPQASQWKPREPGRKTPASENFAELLLDKPGQAFPISNRRNIRRLAVAHDINCRASVNRETTTSAFSGESIHVLIAHDS